MSMKVDVLRVKVYGFNGKELSTGVQDMDTKLAEKLIARGLAEKVEPKQKK